MFVLEYKVKAKEKQYRAIDDAIRTSQFVRNKALRYWLDNRGVDKYDLNKYCRVLAKEFCFADELNSTARQDQPNELGLGYPDFLRTVKNNFLGKRDSQNLRKILAQ